MIAKSLDSLEDFFSNVSKYFVFILQFLSSRFGKGRGTITNSVSGGGQVSSNLYVAKATLADSGNYTCSSSMWQSVKNSSVKVHILVDGKEF